VGLGPVVLGLAVLDPAMLDPECLIPIFIEDGGSPERLRRRRNLVLAQAVSDP
jgi:hypothetical protein